ncbi:ArsC/Spx/MgsR family protein [Lactococcus kimchii]|uniref:ArsC/Spx/MgsR family protein n=1 Tax=Lactococcus sp. S-13 TaxID=2507158 RepID=UPI0010234A6B|nr:ArsC/Spx/MgsR family protein [Lactococcus sp. S-13]RZI48194.1 Spx-like protein [Lactococcus sp. S-13]
MIKIYQKSQTNQSTERVRDWLTARAIPYQTISKSSLSKADLMRVLSLSNKGFDEIMVSESKAPKLYSQLRNSRDLEQMTTDEMIQFLLEHPQLLRSPITFDEQRLLVGYNTDDIRTFLPRFH